LAPPSDTKTKFNAGAQRQTFPIQIISEFKRLDAKVAFTN